MTKPLRTIALAAAAATMAFTACQVEFSPNAEWKETPVVYCLLDQDDDTTWARVERCYLSESDIHDFAGVSDSINFPAGSISVALLEYRNGALQRTLDMQYTLRDRQPGDFASEAQPLYFTDAALNEQCMYKLEVRRSADQSLLASTDSIPLIIKDPDKLLFTKPNLYDRFKFVAKAFTLEWNQLYNARYYKPFIRFYYSESGQQRYVDLNCSSVSSGNNTGRLSLSYSLDVFLNDMYNALKDDTNTKYYLKNVDLYLTACDENLNVYMSNLAGNDVVGQEREPYTNIHGGVGIFAARRTHLYRNIAADSSLAPPDGLWYMLKNLDVGFD